MCHPYLPRTGPLPAIGAVHVGRAGLTVPPGHPQMAPLATAVLGTLFTPCGCPAIGGEPGLFARTPLVPAPPELRLSSPLIADCYSCCIPSSQASGIESSARCWFISPRPWPGWWPSPVPPRAVPCRAVPVLPPPALMGLMASAGESTEPCRAQPWRASGFLCHPQRVCLSVCLSLWVSQSLSVPSQGAEHPWAPL